MNDWADNMAGRIRQRRQNQEVRDAKFVEKQRIKRANGEPLWRQVRDHVKQNCDDLNKRTGETLLTFEVGQLSEIHVRGEVDGKHRILSATYDPEQCTLTYTCGDKSDSWEVLVGDDGTVTFGWGMGIQSTPASIANQMLNTLLGFE